MAVFALFGFNAQALAATDTWTGADVGLSTDWATPDNWLYSSGSGPVASGDSLVFTSTNGSGNNSLTDSLTNSSFLINGITFNAGALAYTMNGDGFELGGSIVNYSANTQTFNNAITLSTNQSLTTNAFGGNLTFGGGILAGAGGIVVSGGGTVTLDGTASTYTGATTVNGGTLEENFAGSVATTNLINASSALNLGGGTLLVNGSASASNAQTFAGTTFVSGMSTIEAVSGTGGATNVTLGALTQDNGAGMVFSLPASGSIGTGISTTAALLGYGVVTTASNGSVSDFAALTASGQIEAGKTVVPASYTTNSAAGNPASLTDPVVEYDVAPTGAQTLSTGGAAQYLLFDTYTSSASGWDFVSGSGNKGWDIPAILVTSAVGADNVSFSVGGTSLGIRGEDSTTPDPFTLNQFDTSGLLEFTNIDFLAVSTFTQNGPGTVVLTTNGGGNTGNNYLNGGATEIVADSAFNNGGTESINLNGGTVLGNASFTLGSATNHPVDLGNSGGGLAATTGNTLTVASLISGAAGTGPLIIGLPTAGGVVPGTGTGTANATPVNAAGIVILSNTGNTYTGGTVIDSGTLQLPFNGSLANFGTGGITLNGGAFQWSGNSIDISTRTVTLAAGGGTFDTNGNNVTLANPIGNNGSGGLTKVGAGSLTLDGSNTFTGSVTLSGGNLIFKAPNIYTGATNINAGTLTLNSGVSLGNTAITVANGGALDVMGNTIGTTGASLALQGGSVFSLQDNSIDTVTLNSTVASGAGTVLSAGGASSAASLDFDLNNTSSDELVINNGVTAFGADGGKIYIDDLNNLSPLHSYTLISDPNGGLAAGTVPGSSFQLGTTSLTANGITYLLSLASSTSTAIILTLNAASVNYYWTGATNSSWSGTGNFATDHTGTAAQTAGLGLTNNVFLTADSATHYSQTLDGNYTINSLSFTGAGTGAATTPITLANGSATALTINGASAFVDAAGNTYQAGTGLVVQAGSAAHTISANINLGNSEVWQINNSSSNPLTMTGVIADAPGTSLDSLTVSGSGALILTNSNAYDGGTIVSGGTLMLAPGGSLVATGGLTVNGGTFNLGNNSQTIGGLYDGGLSTGTITATGAGTLTINNSTPSSYGGTITDQNNINSASSLALVLEGSSNVTLSGSNSFTGGTTLASGNLTVSNNYGLGAATTGTASANAGLTFNNTASSNVYFTSANPHVASINNAFATGADNIILGNASGGGSQTTLVLGNGGSAQIAAGDTFTGTISDLSSLSPGAVGNLEIINGGFVELSGVNTFTGTTVITGSNTQTGYVSELQLDNADALENSTLNYNDPYGIISFGNLTAATLGGLTGTEPLALANNGSVAVTLTLGNNNVSSIYTGNLNGDGGLTKVGNGAVQTGSGTTGGATYGGTTTVDAGTLIIGGDSNLTGLLSVSQGTLIVQDDAVINSGGILYMDNIAGDPTAANLTVSGTASVTVEGFSFGNNTRANGVVTVQNSGSLIVTGSYDFLNTLGGTTVSTNTVTNLNGGTLAVQNFVLVNAGAGPTTAVTLNFNGGTLEALANDPSGSFFLPAIPLLTANVLGGGAIINSNGFNITIAQPLVTGTQNDGGLTKAGAGILYLSASNNYVGPTTIAGGELNLPNINSITDSSRITFTGGALQYSGSNTQDYSSKILNSTAPVAIDVNGQNVTFGTGLAASNAGGLTVADAVPGTGSLTLTGSNVYSGPTTVNSGAQLVLGSGGSLPNSTVTVNGILLAQTNNGGIGAGSASLNLNSGSTLSLVDGAIGSLTVNGGMTIGGSTGAAALDFEVDTDTSTADKITVTGGPLNFGTGGGVITLTDIGATTVPANGTELTLLTDTSGLGSQSFTLSQSNLLIDGQSFLLSLANSTSTAEIVTLTQASLAYYWTGNTSASWKAITNFTSDPAGTQVRSGSLSATSNVFLTANTATNLSQTLDGTYTINSLSFTGTGTSAGTTPVTLASGTGTALTIAASSPFGDANGNTYSIGTGLVAQAGAAADKISANIYLGNSQTWEINNSSSSPLTVSGVIADAPTTTFDSLTKSGSGTLVLSNANTYDGGTIVQAGTLVLGAGGSLLTTGTLTVAGTFDLAGNNQMVGGLSDGGVSTGIITSSTSSATLTVNNLAPSTYSGAITDNNAGNGASLSLVLSGSSNVTLSGSSTFTGGTTLQSGNLTVAANYALGSATSTNPNAGLTLSPALSGTVTAFFTSANPTIATLNNPGAGASNVVLGNTSGAGSATTLNIAATSGTSTFSGVISDLTGTKATAIGNLTLSGGSLTLNGTDTFTGTTLLSAGATLTVGNSLALENSTLNLGGGTLNLGTLTALTLGGLAGSNNLALVNASSAAVNLTIGSGNATSTYTGSLTGSANLSQIGTGVTTLGNDNLTGNVTAGQADVTGGAAGGLTISGGTFGSGTSTLTIAADGNATALNISGGVATFGTVNIATVGGETAAGMEITGGNVTFTTVNVGSTGNTAQGLVINDPSGTVALGTVNVIRDEGGAVNTGLVINAGTVTATAVLLAENAHSADLQITGGSLTIGSSTSNGAFEVGNAGTVNNLTMTGGALTYTGSDGLLLSADAGAGSVASITGATSVATLTGITVNAGSAATDDSTLTVSGSATLYLGSVGLVVYQPSATVSATFGTATVGAFAPWSSSAPISLTGTTTFQAADSNGIANNITLTGVLSGTGGLAVSGTGTVTLAGANTYTGTTAVNAGGRLIVSGSLSATTAASVASGGRLEVDGVLNNGISAVVNGRLSGTGVVGGAAINAGGILAPGLTAADRSSAVGTLTAASNVSLASTATLSIRVGLTSGVASNPATGLGGDVDQLFMNGGTFSLNDTTLQIFSNPAESGAALDSLYVIVNGGAGSTGTGTDVFAGIPSSGDSFTSSNGNVFDVFYGVSAGNTAVSGNDIDVELVAVPEPGVWASLAGGMGMLIVWQRSRRRRS